MMIRKYQKKDKQGVLKLNHLMNYNKIKTQNEKRQDL